MGVRFNGGTDKVRAESSEEMIADIVTSHAFIDDTLTEYLVNNICKYAPVFSLEKHQECTDILQGYPTIKRVELMKVIAHDTSNTSELRGKLRRLSEIRNIVAHRMTFDLLDGLSFSKRPLPTVESLYNEFYPLYEYLEFNFVRITYDYARWYEE